MKPLYHPDFLEEMLSLSNQFQSDGSNPFTIALEETIADACLFPHAAPKTQIDGIRKKTVGKYEFHLIYEVQADTILFFAIAHKRRHPFYWIHRLDS